MAAIKCIYMKLGFLIKFYITISSYANVRINTAHMSDVRRDKFNIAAPVTYRNKLVWLDSHTLNPKLSEYN